HLLSPVVTLHLYHLCRFSLYLFFFHNSGDHRDLHSFPTRRSSDLRARDSSSFIRASSSVASENARSPTSSGSSAIARSRSRPRRDRKSTRLNSSHVAISYAVFCLKKKKNSQDEKTRVRIMCPL